MSNTKFSEKDIRPVNISDEQENALQADIRFLEQRLDRFVKVNCPACDSAHKREKYHKYAFNYDECLKCGTVYMNPRASSELLGEFYAGSENYAFWNKHIFPASEAVRRQRIFVPRVDRVIEYCEKYGSGKNSILEVGAGFGTFCEEMGTRGVFSRIIAVEPTPSLSETCRSKGIETIELPIEQVSFPEGEQMDVVVNFEVIEHLSSPRAFLEKCGELLKPNGLFVVTCPNGQGFDVVTLKEVSKTIDHEHVNYFNPASLGLLLESCGFEVLASETPGVLDADLVRNAVLAGAYRLEGQEFLQQVLIDRWEELGGAFQQFLIENKLSSNMWLIARKK